MSERVRAQRGLFWAIGYAVLGVVIVGVLVILTGGTLDAALQGWFVGAFGSSYSLVQTISNAVPLAVVALGSAIALRAGVISVGAEGQLIVGAIGAAVVGFLVGGSVPLWLGLILGALGGIAGGALWALAPAVAKIRWNVSEILFTLLANYLAIYLLAYLLRTVLRDPETAGSPQSPELPLPFELPQLPVPGRLHIGAILVLVLFALAIWWNRSRSAFVVGVFGRRSVLASRLGLTPTRAVLSTMLVSGAAAGLAGWMQVAGVTQRLEPDISGGIGFAGLAVAVLGRGNPIGILVAAIVYSSLGTGASGVQIATGTVPSSIGTITQGVLLLAAALVLAAPRIVRRAHPAPVAAPVEAHPAPTAEVAS